MKGVADKKVVPIDRQIKHKYCKKCYRFLEVKDQENPVSSIKRVTLARGGIPHIVKQCPRCRRIRKAYLSEKKAKAVS